MSTVSLDLLLEAASPGGPSCLVSVTELEPAAGAHASVAPAKFAAPDPNDKKGLYAYERRYLADGDGAGEFRQAVIIDSKQSQLNRMEAALALAIGDQHPVLSRVPRIVVRYERDGCMEEYSDLTLPHRAFDGHIRAGTVNGSPVTQNEFYRAMRNASHANARALFDASPVSLVFGSWDSMRSSRQARWRSVLVGEIIGFCADDRTARRGGARVDPVGMQVQLAGKDVKDLVEAQKAELSRKNVKDAIDKADKAIKGSQLMSVSKLGLGGIPPALEALAGVACHRIVRSHVLSFATLRQIRFGAGVEGDVACRALLAALALNGLARSDAELCLRANCDLREKAPTVLNIDRPNGERESLTPLTIETADAVLAAALSHAEQTAGVQWQGVALTVVGNPAVVAGAVADDGDES